MTKVGMPDAMKQDVLDSATRAFTRYNSTGDIAQYIKKEFDNKYHRYWQCIVGEQFSFYVHHQTNRCIYFKQDQYYVLLFKSP